MNVLKVGGTSVGNAESIEKVLRTSPAVAVLSEAQNQCLRFTS